MVETIRIWSQNYSEVLLETDSRAQARDFFLATDYAWLPVVVRRQDADGTEVARWSGRLERADDAEKLHLDREYLEKILVWEQP